jgi:hypothetical protein
MGRGIRQVKEDFECENCGLHVSGNGFTNHCPECLCSKHVDDVPGDRAMLDECGCLMEPVGVRNTRGGVALVHKCINCNVESINRTSPDDDQDELQRIIYASQRGRGRRASR